MPSWSFNVVMPGWNDLCLGFDLLKSTVTTSLNGNLGQAAEVNWIGYQIKKLLANSKIRVQSEFFSDFNIFSLPINKLVSGKAGDLLAWNIKQWAWHERAHNTTIDKTDGGTTFLVLTPELNFMEVVSYKKL